jgi:hypothetical protein
LGLVSDFCPISAFQQFWLVRQRGLTASIQGDAVATLKVNDPCVRAPFCGGLTALKSLTAGFRPQRQKGKHHRHAQRQNE